MSLSSANIMVMSSIEVVRRLCLEAWVRAVSAELKTATLSARFDT